MPAAARSLQAKGEQFAHALVGLGLASQRRPTPIEPAVDLCPRCRGQRERLGREQAGETGEQ